jgi:hypothetical protein
MLEVISWMLENPNCVVKVLVQGTTVKIELPVLDLGVWVRNGVLTHPGSHQFTHSGEEELVLFRWDESAHPTFAREFATLCCVNGIFQFCPPMNG